MRQRWQKVRPAQLVQAGTGLVNHLLHPDGDGAGQHLLSEELREGGRVPHAQVVGLTVEDADQLSDDRFVGRDDGCGADEVGQDCVDPEGHYLGLEESQVGEQ